MAPAGFSVLPTEVLDDIARRVGPLDNVACSAVCKPWRCAVKAARLRPLKHPNRQHHVCVEPRYDGSPWELDYYLRGKKRRSWTEKICLRPMDCSTPERFVAVDLDTTGKNRRVHPTRIIGCNYGWVVTVDTACTLSLLEPLTGRLFPLPPITASLGRAKKVLKNVQQMGQDMFHKAALAPGRRLGTCAVMLIHSGGYGLSFLGPGAKCWTALREPAWAPKNYLDVVFHKGAFYTVSVDSELNAWAPDGSSTGLRARLVASPRTEPVWAVLVESAAGDDLFMLSTPNIPGHRLYLPPPSSFEVSRYDEREGQWIAALIRGDMKVLVKENISLCIWRRGRPPCPAMAIRNKWSYEQVSYSSDSTSSYMNYSGLYLRGGCWFLPYVAPEFPHS